MCGGYRGGHLPQTKNAITSRAVYHKCIERSSGAGITATSSTQNIVTTEICSLVHTAAGGR